MKAALSLAIILLFTFPCFSQEVKALPETPKPKLKVRFFEHVLLTTAGETFAMLDAHSTREIQVIGGRENNPLLRPFVHSDGLYAEQTIEQAGLAWLGWKMHRSHNRFFRATWWAPQVAQITFNIRGWRGNVHGLDQHSCWVRYGRLNCFQ